MTVVRCLRPVPAGQRNDIAQDLKCSRSAQSNPATLALQFQKEIIMTAVATKSSNNTVPVIGYGELGREIVTQLLAAGRQVCVI